eukprot:jgi/Astpho2/1907/fgenesh1_pg.00038_%23_56_t
MEPAQPALISSFYLYIWSVKASQEIHCHQDLPLKSIEGISQPEKTPNYSPAEMQAMLQDLVGPAMMLPPSTGHQIAQQGQHGPPELVNPLLQAMQAITPAMARAQLPVLQHQLKQQLLLLAWPVDRQVAANVPLHPMFHEGGPARVPGGGASSHGAQTAGYFAGPPHPGQGCSMSEPVAVSEPSTPQPAPPNAMISPMASNSSSRGVGAGFQAAGPESQKVKQEAGPNPFNSGSSLSQLPEQVRQHLPPPLPQQQQSAAPAVSSSSQGQQQLQGGPYVHPPLRGPSGQPLPGHRQGGGVGLPPLAPVVPPSGFATAAGPWHAVGGSQLAELTELLQTLDEEHPAASCQEGSTSQQTAASQLPASMQLSSPRGAALTSQSSAPAGFSSPREDLHSLDLDFELPLVEDLSTGLRPQRSNSMVMLPSLGASRECRTPASDGTKRMRSEDIDDGSDSETVTVSGPAPQQRGHARSCSWPRYQDKQRLLRLVGESEPRSAEDWEVVAGKLCTTMPMDGASAERMWRSLRNAEAQQSPAGKHGCRRNSRKGKVAMHIMATYALGELAGNEGNLNQIAAVIEQHPEYSRELDFTPRPGTKTYPRWKDALVGCFKQGRYPHLYKTERKFEGLSVYALDAGAASLRRPAKAPKLQRKQSAPAVLLKPESVTEETSDSGGDDPDFCG